MLYTCDYCGKEFQTTLPKLKRSKNHYCSIKCRANSSRKLVERTCKQCGKIFKVNPSDKKKFCSPKCGFESRKKHNTIITLKDYSIVILQAKNKIFECLVSNEDLSKIKDFYWYSRIDKRHPKLNPYVQTHVKGKRIHLHRYLIDCPANKVVDHINGNPLDNRKNNLRIVTQSQNIKNRNDKLICGVYYNARDNYWLCQLGDKVYGRYANQKDAIKKRQELNFLMKNNEWEKLEELKCVSLIDSNNGLQRNNKTGVVGISKVRNANTYQVHYKGTYLGTVKTVSDGVELQKKYINSLKHDTTHLE